MQRLGMGIESDSKETVMSYIRALDGQDYDGALKYLHDRVRIRGPAGETFGKPLDFIEMLRKYHGRYDVKKVFSDEDDVCVLYDLKTTGPTVFMSSWYQVSDGKIVSIQTVFDPRAFGPPPGKGPNPDDRR
jgi:SnoaL-like protein